MQTLLLKITYNDGASVEAPAGLADFAAWEDHFDLPVSVLGDPERRRITHMFWLAHHALCKNPDTKGRTVEDFDAWSSTVADIDSVEEAEPVPLDREASPT